MNYRKPRDWHKDRSKNGLRNRKPHFEAGLSAFLFFITLTSFRTMSEVQQTHAAEKPPYSVVWLSMNPVLENLVDASAVQVINRYSRDKVNPIKQGYYFEWGDHFSTGPKAVMRIVFDQNVQVLVGKNTQATLEEEKYEEKKVSSDQTYRFSTPVFHLLSGEIQVIVGALEDKYTEGLKFRSPYRFFVKTPYLTTAVTGTNFLVSVQSQRTEVQILSGTVTVGESPSALEEGFGQQVPAEKSISAQLNRTSSDASGEKTIKLSGLQNFSITDAVKGFSLRNPKLEVLLQTAARDNRSGILQRQFNSLRRVKIRPFTQGEEK